MFSKISRGAKYAFFTGTAFCTAGILYYFFIKITGLAIPCMIKATSGLECPTCGITHMFSHLFEMDFAAAFESNPFMFCTWPLIGAEILYVVYMGFNNRELPKWNYVVLFIYIFLLLVFGVVRNIL